MARFIPFLPEEKTLLKEFFLNSLDLTRLCLYEGGFYSLGSTRAVGNGIYFQPSIRFRKIRSSPFGRSLLIHEATHSWQFQRVGIRYACGSLWDQLRFTITTGSRGGAYCYDLLPEKPLLSYGYEQQAQLLQDYFLRRWCQDNTYTHSHCRDYQKIDPEKCDEICERRRQELAAFR